MMNNADKPHFASSLTLDDWLDEPDARPTQNWLLTYIDVFVLIVMLVVTLIALSSFEDSKPVKTYKKATIQAKVASPVKAAEQPFKKPPLKREQEQQVEKSIVHATALKKTAKMPTHTTQAKEIKLIKETRQKVGQSVEKVLPVAKAKSVEEKVSKPVNQQQETEKAKQYLQQKLKSLGLQDKIQMTVEKGYAQLEIQDNILYQSSAADLSESGKTVLKRLTPLLQQSAGLIYIEGHTDNRPIKTSKFPSNWELGAARATSVLHFLAEQQIDPSRMRAVTYADTKPIADNNTAAGRQKNRRVNIIIKVADEN